MKMNKTKCKFKEIFIIMIELDTVTKIKDKKINKNNKLIILIDSIHL